jgi:hypothetical protein
MEMLAGGLELVAAAAGAVGFVVEMAAAMVPAEAAVVAQPMT